MIATPPHNGTTDPRPGPPGRRIRVLVNGVHAHSGGGVTYLRNMLPMPGVFVTPQDVAIGQIIEDLILLAECSTEGEWEGQVHYLPLR